MGDAQPPPHVRDFFCISIDFSAQYEHPPRSNMDNFAVTHSPQTKSAGERRVTIDIWRIFSEAKGSGLFHNQGLDDIVAYYAKTKKMDLMRVFVFARGLCE
jgi:hypothetical protein